MNDNENIIDARDAFEEKRNEPDVKAVFAHMEQSMGGAVSDDNNKKFAAQDLVYEAWDSRDPDEIYGLLKDAVELDAGNVDARLGLMDFLDLDTDERIEYLRDLLGVAKEELGDEFAEFKGHFWGFMETRPYMRVRSQLALRLMEAGRIEESILEHEGMLELNPNDNQGVRYGLLACCLMVKQLDGAKRILDQYEEEIGFSAMLAWGYILERFLSDDIVAAKKGLKQAKDLNGYVAAYFSGHRKLPKVTPSGYSPGSREEAVVTYEILGPAWDKYPAAQSWLSKNK